MPRTRTIPAALGIAAGLLIFLANPEQAQACSPPIAGLQVFTNSTTVPANGAVAWGYSCYTCETAPADLVIQMEDADGNPIAGELERFPTSSMGEQGFFVPDAPLSEGEYTVVVTTDVGGGSFTVIVGPSEDPTAFAPDVMRDTAVLIDYEGETVCCEEGEMDTCGSLQCYLVAEEAVYLPLVTFDFSLDSSPSVGQYVFQGISESASKDHILPWTTAPYLQFEDALAEETCFTIRAKHVASGEEFTIFEECLDDSVLDFPDLTGAVEEHNRGIFSLCSVVPPEFEDMWCATFADEVASQTCEFEGQETCEAALESCPAVPQGSGGALGMGGSAPGGSDAGGRSAGGNEGTGAGDSGGAGSSKGSGGNGSGGAEGPEGSGAQPSEPSDAGDSGLNCAFSPLRSGQSGSFAWLALALLTFTVRRRSPVAH